MRSRRGDCVCGIAVTAWLVRLCCLQVAAERQQLRLGCFPPGVPGSVVAWMSRIVSTLMAQLCWLHCATSELVPNCFFITAERTPNDVICLLRLQGWLSENCDTDWEPGASAGLCRRTIYSILLDVQTDVAYWCTCLLELQARAVPVAAPSDGAGRTRRAFDDLGRRLVDRCLAAESGLGCNARHCMLRAGRRHATALRQPRIRLRTAGMSRYQHTFAGLATPMMLP